MKKAITLFGLLILIVLTACSPSGGEVPAVAAQVSPGDAAAVTPLEEVPAADSEFATTLEEIPTADTTGNGDSEIVSEEVQSGDISNDIQLNEDYVDALPVQTQLALGTMLLEKSDLAVNGYQAATILPLWQVVQSLSASGTAADAEIAAVINQIQAGMVTEQIAAIVDMKLTQDELRSLVQEGVIAIDLGDVKRGSSNEAAGSGARVGGSPGGGGGALGGQADPARQATREAGGGGGGNDLFNQGLTKAVVQMLASKTT